MFCCRCFMDSRLKLGHVHLEKQEIQDVSCLAVGPFGIQAMAVADCWPRPCQNMCNRSHCPPSWPDVSLELFLTVAAPLIRNQADGKVILLTENFSICLNQGCNFELTVWGVEISTCYAELRTSPHEKRDLNRLMLMKRKPARFFPHAHARLCLIWIFTIYIILLLLYLILVVGGNPLIT